jgi:hypothetical protein
MTGRLIILWARVEGMEMGRAREAAPKKVSRLLTTNAGSTKMQMQTMILQKHQQKTTHTTALAKRGLKGRVRV